MSQYDAPMGRILAALAAVTLLLAGCGDDPINSPEQVKADEAKYGGGPTTTTTGIADSPKDNDFIKALDIGNVPYPNRDDAVLQAQAACVFLSPANGGTYLGATQGVEQHNPTFTDEQVGFFVGAAVQVLCPDEVSELPTSSNDESAPTPGGVGAPHFRA